MIFSKTKIKRHPISTCIYNIWRSGNKSKVFLGGSAALENLIFSWCLDEYSNQLSGKTTRSNSKLNRSAESFWQASAVRFWLSSVFPLQSWLFHRQEELNDFVIILSHIDPQGRKAAPVCLCKYSSLPDHFWWCIIIHTTSWSRIQAAQGINGDLIEQHLDKFTRSENTCTQWFALIMCSKGTEQVFR